MYHSLTFIKNGNIEKNTWDNWHLIPTSRPVFNPPDVKTKYVKIPGSNKVIDMTESLTGYPVYGNREGSIEFVVENGYGEWYNLYSEILSFLNGQYMKVILEDDPAYYYKGRFSVNEWKSDVHWSLITIDYSLKPYKLSVQTTTEDWKWDPFNFENGIIQAEYFANIEVDSDSPITYDFSLEGLIGRKPVCPKIIVSSSDSNGIFMIFVNSELGILLRKSFNDGENNDPRFIFSNISSNNSIGITLEGHGKISIDFRSGGL